MLGWSKFAQVYRISKVGDGRGLLCAGRHGKRASPRCALLRDNVVVTTGELDSLKRFKDDVREVKAGSNAVCR